VRDCAVEVSDVLDSAFSFYKAEVAHSGVEVHGLSGSHAVRRHAHEVVLGSVFYPQHDECPSFASDGDFNHPHEFQKEHRRAIIEKRKYFRSRPQANSKQIRRLARHEEQLARCRADRRRLHRGAFHSRGGRFKCASALGSSLQTFCGDWQTSEYEFASVTQVSGSVDLGPTPEKP
jgi:hypothetical protein